MKYKTEQDKVMIKYIMNILLEKDKILFMVKNIFTYKKRLIPNINNNPVGYLLFKGWFSEFRNILSLATYFTPLYLLVIYITIPNETSKVGNSKEASTSSTVLLKKALKTTPSKNNRFQELSLFRRALNQFSCKAIVTSELNRIALILSWFATLRKVFIYNLVLLAVNFTSFMATASDLTDLITKAELSYNIPSGLLKSIAKVESGFTPLSLNAVGKTMKFTTKEEVLAKITELLEQGITNIDIGVMQLNYRWHSKQFNNIEAMLIPEQNIYYAAQLLSGFYKQYGSWQQAVRYYHSAKPQHHKQYSRKVLLSWLEE